MVTKSYQSLYDSSIAFGMKKALVATKAKTDMVERIKALEKENNSLDEKTAAMQEYIKAKTDEHE
jgi:dynein light intermediate chain, axonemal